MEQPDETDRGVESLINELLTRVGIIMEDVSPIAILKDSHDGELAARIGAVLSATEQITALITAAEALLKD